jgi:hypothetical protein
VVEEVAVLLTDFDRALAEDSSHSLSALLALPLNFRASLLQSKSTHLNNGSVGSARPGKPTVPELGDVRGRTGVCQNSGVHSKEQRPYRAYHDSSEGTVGCLF